MRTFKKYAPRRAGERINTWGGKLRGALDDASLSDLDSLMKFGAYLQAMEKRDRRDLKRYWRDRRRKLEQKKGRKRYR